MAKLRLMPYVNRNSGAREDTSEISNTSEISKRQGNLWIILVPIIAIILIVVTTMIILRHRGKIKIC